MIVYTKEDGFKDEDNSKTTRFYVFVPLRRTGRGHVDLKNFTNNNIKTSKTAKPNHYPIFFESKETMNRFIKLPRKDRWTCLRDRSLDSNILDSEISELI